MDSELCVCTYNIHKGFCAANRRNILSELRHAIRSVSADLVFLQEVVGDRRDRSGGVYLPQFEFLADEVWPHHAYGKNAEYDRGHHGNAVLSKNPILEWSNRDVSRWRFSKRGILFGRLINDLHFVCIHFGLLKRERSSQWRHLEMLLSEKIPRDAPLIIAGDFNDWPAHLHRMIDRLSLQEAHSEMHGRLARTYPADLPVLAMDRIYYRNLSLIDAGVLSGGEWRKLSDHRALFARFHW